MRGFWGSTTTWVCTSIECALTAGMVCEDLTLVNSSLRVNSQNSSAWAGCTPRLGIGDLVWHELTCAVPTIGGSGRDLTASVLYHEHTTTTAAVLEYCAEDDIEFIFVLVSEKMFVWL